MQLQLQLQWKWQSLFHKHSPLQFSLPQFLAALAVTQLQFPLIRSAEVEPPTQP